jgi:hypothetical protein
MLPNLLVQRIRTAQARLETTVITTANRLTPNLALLSQAGAGGVIRTIANSTLATFGPIAVQAGQDSYSELRAFAFDEPFRFQALTLDIEELAAPVISGAMRLQLEGNFAAARTAIGVSLGRSVINAYREQMVSNSLNDRQATGYQRVASPNACAFCLVVALNEYTSFAASGGYHKNCSCTTIPIFRSLGAFRPSYYDQFDSDYSNARADASSNDAQSIFAQMRVNTGRK